MSNETPLYRIVIDIDSPLPSVEVPSGYHGLGVFLRSRNRPIGYFHHRAEPSKVFSPGEFAELILQKAGADIIRSAFTDPHSPSTMALPSVSVAICTKDRAWSLAMCLESLERLQFPNEGDTPAFEILVVDNAPSDSSTKDLVQSLRAARYVLESKPGLDFARNTAVRHATGDYLAFLDDDVTVDSAWFDGLAAALATNPDAGGVTGSVMPMELGTRAQILFEERGGFNRGFGSRRNHQDAIANVSHPCDAGMFGAGCNMAFRRDLLLEIGLFDEALDTGAPLPGGGDLDIFYRVLRAGKALVYQGSMAVYHRHRRDYKGLRRQMWTWGQGYLAFAAKTHQTDAANRFRVRMAALGSFVFFARMAIGSALGRWKHEWTFDLAAWEIAGAIQGLAGEYRRSQRRIHAILARHA